MINVEKLTQEIISSGIKISGCNINGVVWAEDGKTEIQKRADVALIIKAHDPTPVITKTIEDRIIELESKTAVIQSDVSALKRVPLAK